MWLTREACVTLNEYVEEDPSTTGCCAQSHANCRQVLTHLNSAIIVLTTHADPPLVWFSPTAIKLNGTLRFSMLQIREHIDTLLDRKDQTSEVNIFFNYNMIPKLDYINACTLLKLNDLLR